MRIFGTGTRSGIVVALPGCGAPEGGPPPPPPEFAQLTGYWEGLRDGGALPRRAAIDPRGIAHILDRSFLLERIAPGLARFRLAGMALCDLMGMDLRGMPLSALILPPGRESFAATLEQVFAGPRIGHVTLGAERGIGLPPLSVRMLLLPVTGTSGMPDRALGCVAVSGRTGRRPRRFAPSDSTLREIPGLTGTAAPAPMPAPMPEPMPEPMTAGFAEPPAPAFRPAPGAPRPYLRLVSGSA